MNVIERRNLSKEAEMQIKALKKINLWKKIAMAVSTIGVALAYAGFAGIIQSLFLGIFGVVLTIVAIIAALVFNLGLKNGRRNVEKMLSILEKGNLEKSKTLKKGKVLEKGKAS